MNTKYRQCEIGLSVYLRTGGNTTNDVYSAYQKDVTDVQLHTLLRETHHHELLHDIVAALFCTKALLVMLCQNSNATLSKSRQPTQQSLNSFKVVHIPPSSNKTMLMLLKTV